jgi:gamma-glutamyl hercynylcysteine S-oxide synthase
VSDAVAARLRGAFSAELAYFAELSLYHELMHIEAWWMAFQYLGYAPPTRPEVAGVLSAPRLAFAGGEVELGSGPDEGFIFDNEKWRHTVPVAAFDIDASPVSETAFAGFVDAGGYENSRGGRKPVGPGKTASAARHPLYWRQENGSWQVRRFDRWRPLSPDDPCCM